MKMLMAAIALSVAIPGIAQAQVAVPPSQKPKMECCCKDKSKPMDCCDKHGGGKTGQDEHAGHDMDQQSKPQR